MELVEDYFDERLQKKLLPLDEDLCPLDTSEASPKDFLAQLNKGSPVFEPPMEPLEPEQRPHERLKMPFTLVRMPDCCICMEQFEESFKLKHSCKFICCQECGAQYLKSQIAERIINPLCPETDCRTPLTTEEILVNLESEWQLKYEEIAFDKSKDEMPDYCHCPAPNCPGGGLFNPDTDSFCYCVVCNLKFCPKCQEEWHAGFTCEQRQQWKIENSENDKRTAEWKKLKTKDCPNCHSPIEKTVGCDHMTCWRCKYEFCWQCLEKYYDGHIREKHSSLSLLRPPEIPFLPLPALRDLVQRMRAQNTPPTGTPPANPTPQPDTDTTRQTEANSQGPRVSRSRAFRVPVGHPARSRLPPSNEDYLIMNFQDFHRLELERRCLKRKLDQIQTPTAQSTVSQSMNFTPEGREVIVV